MPSATRYFMLSLAVGALAPLLIATGPDSAQAFPARGERTFTVSPDGDDGSIRRAGIRSVRNKGVVIRGNKIDGMGTWGIFTSSSDGVRIENNSVVGSVKEHGIYASNTTAQPVIRGNTAAGNNMCGIHLN